jgi:hypothetical protein
LRLALPFPALSSRPQSIYLPTMTDLELRINEPH